MLQWRAITDKAEATLHYVARVVLYHSQHVAQLIGTWPSCQEHAISVSKCAGLGRFLAMASLRSLYVLLVSRLVADSRPERLACTSQFCPRMTHRPLTAMLSREAAKQSS